MKENYIISAFRETVKRDFAGRAQVLNEAFDGRLQSLRQENADASSEKQRHLEGQILPGIAAYETLQTVLPKEQALQTVHGYVEQHAQNFRRTPFSFCACRALPSRARYFASATKKHFGQSAGFAAKEYQTSGGVAHRHDAVSISRHVRKIRLPLSSAAASATATTCPMKIYIRSSSGTGRRRSAAAATAAISASKIRGKWARRI